MSTAADPERRLLLLDTHVLVWSVDESARLGRTVREKINEAARQSRIGVSAISPWELALLVKKGRLQLRCDVMQWVRDALAGSGVRLVPMEPEIAVESTRLPFEMHSDPADRILVATARHLGATLVTADQALLDLSKKGHFAAMDASK